MRNWVLRNCAIAKIEIAQLSIWKLCVYPALACSVLLFSKTLAIFLHCKHWDVALLIACHSCSAFSKKCQKFGLGNCIHVCQFRLKGLNWNILGTTGALFERQGPSGKRQGPLLGATGALLGATGALVGATGALRGRQGPLWVRQGPSLGSTRAHHGVDMGPTRGRHVCPHGSHGTRKRARVRRKNARFC